MIEQISPAAKAAAEKALEACKAGKEQASSQLAEDAAKKALDAVNRANMKLAKLPEEVISSLNEAVQTLMKAINGWENPSAPEFDPDALVAKLEALLNPVVETLVRIISEVGLPEIPGLSQIKALLAALQSAKSSKPDGWTSEWPPGGKRPEVPPELKRTLQELLVAVQSLMITLPAVLVNILFNAVDLILGAQIPVVGMSLYSIIGMVPYIKQVPELVALCPKISNLIVNAAGQLGGAVEGKLMDLMQQVQTLSIPPPPEDVEAPESLPACPQRG